MATVHRALERGPDGFERMVALKRLLPHLAEDASFIKSFVREAKLASILNHINIVQIYELGRVGSEYFISMEYIDGRDVRRILRHARKVTGPPPIHVTVALLIQLCEALDYAHAKHDDDGTPLRLVHRDVSPSNVIVTSSGHLKVIDFGIAKAESSQLRTQTGRVKGKLAYMAPEAIAGGRDLDARSDLWAVGVILHELLTARPLFASKNEYQTLLKVQKGEIMPPSTFNQGCPPELDAVVFKALARTPDDRFTTAGDMREELLEIKRQYSLQTGYRDVAAWLDWAFSLEQPGNFTNQPTTGVSEVDPISKQVRAKTPRPARNHEEDEAVEMVWGNEGEVAGAGPVLLDDVPDVTAKPNRLATEIDDIPDHAPTHGSHGGADSALLTLAAQGTEMPPPGPPDLARGTELPIARGTAQMRSTAAGSQPKQRPTGPQRAVRQTGSVSVPKPAGTTGSMTVPRSPTGPLPVPRTPTGPLPVPPRTTSRGIAAQRTSDRVPVQRTSDETNPDATPLELVDPASQSLRAEDLFGPDEAAGAAITKPPARKETEFEVTTNPAAPALPPELPSVPVVRFSKSMSVPPVNERSTPAAGLPVPAPIPTRQGLAVARPASIPPANVPLLQPKRPSQAMSVPAGTVRSNKRMWVAIAIGVSVAGVAGTAMLVLSSKHPGDASAHVIAPASSTTEPALTTGTVKFVTEPADAEIKVEGMPSHTGGPWTIELPAGIHQVEIHRQGYKAWLTSVELSARETQTLRVVLEPLAASPAAQADASLAISTTPPGLEATLDGQPLAEKTPTKTTLKIGPHTIAVKQNGVEVWHQQFTAEASSDYEFNPSFTADKQRERAERATTRPHAAPSAEPRDDAKPETLPTDPAKPEATTPEPPPEVPAPKAEAAPPAPIVKPAVAIVPAHQAPPSAPLPVAPSAPVIVPQSQVQKLSGETPNIEAFNNSDVPAMISAKLCIDPAGKVAAVTVLTRLDRQAGADLATALRAWSYAPYRKAGTAVAACFVVTLRVK